jgi:hypothetical protein
LGDLIRALGNRRIPGVYPFNGSNKTVANPWHRLDVAWLFGRIVDSAEFRFVKQWTEDDLNMKKYDRANIRINEPSSRI